MSKKKCDSHQQNHNHPDHSQSLPRLRRLQGQLSGIEKMIQDRRYCVDILIQLRASLSALRNLETEIFENHLRSCVEDTLKNQNSKEVSKKLDEIMDLIKHRVQF